MPESAYHFYEPKGSSGYVHAKCWGAYAKAQQVLGLGRPVPSSAMRTIGRRAGAGPCLHCHEILIQESA